MCLLLKSTAPRLLKSLVISLSVARSPLAQSLFLHWFYCLQKGLLFKNHFLVPLFALQAPATVILWFNVLDRVGVRFFFSCWFYSDAVAGAREALICGVSSLYMSLNWKKDVSYESDMKDAVGVSLPLIYAVVKSIQEGVCP
ncbi:hypothetical protein PRUPE_3G133700 [Prunus persica]|uniref:Uncharacterized protein n=1 Tax=Prunus persica TaxID=3760 RepID=A0A251PZM2_PRUPE|nr:uncharacterized protein LOC109948285 isoform X3 [Prunus persica]ONI17010.1 hypothetical protein PRUPE_3G133700 [Prunus persica]ONI17011.1 hypothetical protein PRUPE_3G133700 [Prunus persica]ONI17012.1 hypothetical protein PRUPE_3G133700 [Prunus persica]ONI17013.1 hypothetical protein PRUPE_3G133700 [Prunus persica]